MIVIFLTVINKHVTRSNRPENNASRKHKLNIIYNPTEGNNVYYSKESLAFMAGSRVIEINTRATHPISPIFLMFFAYKKLLDRTEMRTRDRICFQPIRTV